MADGLTNGDALSPGKHAHDRHAADVFELMDDFCSSSFFDLDPLGGLYMGLLSALGNRTP